MAFYIAQTLNQHKISKSVSKYGGLFMSEHYTPDPRMGDSYQILIETDDQKIEEGMEVAHVIDNHVAVLGRAFSRSTDNENDWKIGLVNGGQMCWAEINMVHISRSSHENIGKTIPDEQLHYLVKYFNDNNQTFPEKIEALFKNPENIESKFINMFLEKRVIINPGTYGVIATVMDIADNGIMFKITGESHYKYLKNSIHFMTFASGFDMRLLTE